MNYVLRLGLLLTLAAAVSCARSIPEEAKESLAKPVDCETAEADVARLEAEKASVAKQVSSGIRSLVPAAAVVGILRGDAKDRASVATGVYNREIETKIDEIRQQCGALGARVTEEGLIQLEQARVGFAAVKPGLDLSRYDRIIVLPVYIAFKKTRDSYELPEDRVEDMKRYFNEAIVKQLDEKGGYPVVTEAGADVLLLRAALADVVVKVPPEPTSARDRVYVHEAGEMTLVAELRDSVSGELLARAADRRSVSHPGGAYRSSSVYHVNDVRRLFDFWASNLRERLDEAHASPPAGDG